MSQGRFGSCPQAARADDQVFGALPLVPIYIDRPKQAVVSRSSREERGGGPVAEYGDAASVFGFGSLL